MILPIFYCLIYKNDTLAQFDPILMEVLPCTEPRRIILFDVLPLQNERADNSDTQGNPYDNFTKIRERIMWKDALSPCVYRVGI